MENQMKRDPAVHQHKCMESHSCNLARIRKRFIVQNRVIEKGQLHEWKIFTHLEAVGAQRNLQHNHCKTCLKN